MKKEKKTWWWRWGVVGVWTILIFMAYVLNNQLKFGFCDNIYSTDNYYGCLDKASKTIGEPLFLLSLSLAIISPLLFFISDKIFIRWLRFSLIWFGLAIIFIGVSPQYSGGWMSLGPTKESVSITMSALFVMLSLGIVGYNKYGERRK